MTRPKSYVIVVCDVESKANGTVRYASALGRYELMVDWTLYPSQAMQFQSYRSAAAFLRKWQIRLSAMTFYPVPFGENRDE